MTLLAELRALDAAMTAGPWEHVARGPLHHVVAGAQPVFDAYAGRDKNPDHVEADARGSARLRTLLPAMVAAVEERERYRRALQDVRDLLVVRPHRFADQSGKIHDVLDAALARPKMPDET